MIKDGELVQRIVCNEDELPVELLNKVEPYGFRGIFLGGCIARGVGSNIRPSAHCHCNKIKNKKTGEQWPYFGWICIKSRKIEKVIKNGKPTNLLKHELAHLMSAKQGGYGKAFCKSLIDLDGRLFKVDHKTVRDNMKQARKEASKPVEL